ncbi:ubiquitin carboxyl-terminal hydrolase 27 isoform X1 [Nicotiana tomentosiformis]|uniref:ubiquitin carboxyl-terminal hydrolase 27 isoform X1 n=1 Tax=Nicotiana tomentosiformis TaxID=4098 RepID=UPI00051ACAE1|nr:ubiquitin carboxyl-terminal hydrolase 27 isoform X1 [Nicotiana tomentosiformis]
MKIHGNIDSYSLVNKFKHGFKSHWVTAHGVQVSVAATLLSVAGFIFAIKDGKLRNFMVSEKHSSNSYYWTIPGLQNLGNNCFLNVVLQALASCKSFSKFLEQVVEECEGSSMEGSVDLPVIATLASLVQELCIARHGRAVLSPRRLMHAMTSYIPNFNLTSQQDAEEALSHLLSSLRAELSESYVHDHSSLADVATLPNCRIVMQRMEGESEQERWQQSFLGPFDGILGSFLTCQSCSFQISLDFQLFHSLHLVPVLSSSGAVMPGCSVEHCLKQFFVAEKLENYKCSHCWHIAAVKFVSAMDENEAIVEKLKLCNEEDSCDCKELACLARLPWSNNFSRTFKQLSIGRSPKVLCLHLQRASINVFGELVKLQGHISFPLILDLAPFVKNGVGTKNWEEKLQIGKIKHQQQSFPLFNYLNLQDNNEMLNCSTQSERKYSTEVEDTADLCISNKCGVNTPKSISTLLETEGYKETSLNQLPPHSENQREASPITLTGHHMYRLASVVQHFGRVGSGHYTVYRRVTAKIIEDYPAGLLGSAVDQWSCISDTDVHSVSEKDVLDAEATLLFYEKVSDC